MIYIDNSNSNTCSSGSNSRSGIKHDDDDDDDDDDLWIEKERRPSQADKKGVCQSLRID